jgi:5,10-methylenetetrahydromethanopterin reductase
MMVRPRFGLAFPPGPPSEVAELAIMAEDLGFDRLGLSDSQSLFRETYVSCAVAAGATSSLLIGPRVTNAATRHAAVTASAMASLQELSGGRAFLGIGTGDSALLNLGLRPSRLDELEPYVTSVRSLWTDGHAELGGTDMNLSWYKGLGLPAIPIHIAAEGPRTLRMAARIADEVLVGMGLSGEVVRHSIEIVAEGASGVGRNPGDIDLWWMTKANIGDDPDRAMSQMRMALAASAHHVFRFTREGKFVPPALQPAIEELLASYRYNEHEAPGDRRHNAELVDRLGLTHFLAERFALVGDAAGWIDKIGRLVDAGAHNFWLTVHVPDKRTFVRTVGEQVLPYVR